MTFIGGVNRVLERTLRVRVMRADNIRGLRNNAQAAKDERARSRNLEKKSRNLEEKVQNLDDEVGKLKKTLEEKSKPRKPKLPADYDEDFPELWERVRERTMTSHEKVYTLYNAVRYVVRNEIPGAIVECGVWRGGSMLAVAHLLSQLEVRDRDLYLFDTYEGMTEPTDRDIQISNNKTAQERLDTEDQTSWVWAVASLEDVQEGFAPVSYPSDRVHFVKGPVEETVPGEAPKQISILRLDTDWYESTKHELNHLYQRLAPGGVLIIDDYGTWQGSKDATDEFLAETGEPLMVARAGTGRMSVKPGLQTRVPGE